MRRYAIGVDLLDKEDPSRVIARLDEPILIPQEDERDGYVPNVVVLLRRDGSQRPVDHPVRHVRFKSRESRASPWRNSWRNSGETNLVSRWQVQLFPVVPQNTIQPKADRSSSAMAGRHAA
jgi:hypothetical protein